MSRKELCRKGIECVVCKKIFDVPLKTGCVATHCSDECRNRSRLIVLRRYTKKKKLKEYKETRNCPICEVMFTAEGKGYHQRYCSEKCAHREEYNKRNKKRADSYLMLVCPYCGKEFSNCNGKTYCSQECYLESLKARECICACLLCGEEFTQNGHKRKYCSPLCAAKAQEEVYRIHTLTRRALSKTNGNVEKIKPRDIFERDKWICQICGEQVQKELYKTKGTKRYAHTPSIDHIIPISKGGEHTKANVQCACYLCNCKKSNKIIVNIFN